MRIVNFDIPGIYRYDDADLKEILLRKAKELLQRLLELELVVGITSWPVVGITTSRSRVR